MKPAGRQTANTDVKDSRYRWDRLRIQMLRTADTNEKDSGKDLGHDQRTIRKRTALF